MTADPPPALAGASPIAGVSPTAAGPLRRSVDVLVIGAGPAGLTAAARLAAAGAGRVEVVDREPYAGGLTRHCPHRGFGVSDLHRLLTGPDYARHLADAAVRAGAVLRTGAGVTGWAGPLTAAVTGPAGLERLTARAVVLATGARERPRSARLVPGTRPAGVLTNGQVLRSLHGGLRSPHGGHRGTVGRRAVVVGAGPSGRATALALGRAGTEVAALVTGLPRHRSSWAQTLPALPDRGIPLLADTTVTGLHGRDRVEAVGLRHRDGRAMTLRCDTVVFTGDWIPDHELARTGGISLAPGSRGPSADTAFRTSEPKVFAVGTLLRPGESAGTAARDGALVAEPVLRHLAGGGWPPAPVPVLAEAPLAWVTPDRIGPVNSLAAHGRFSLEPAEVLVRPRLIVRQDGRTLHRQRVWETAVPGRPVRLSAAWCARAAAHGGPVLVSVA
ncbi:NAD(P)/FAD-dependent oxidoreductase [Streptomyces sp. NPDC001922]|uniref:NAD(P)/FAD-dependent oxidoreductase n=1 Tax=Streptomyces sp. NPDC001922 TaxID=3364624 RepID=UPI0036A34006